MTEKTVTTFRLPEDLNERWKEYLERNDTTKTDHAKELVEKSIAKDISEDFKEIQNRIEREARRDSFELIKGDMKIPVREDENGNKEFLKPENFQERIDETKEQIADIEKELNDLKSEREEIMLEGALDGGVSTSDLEENKKRKNDLEEKKEDLESILSQYQRAKQGASQIEQDREKLENRLIANRMKAQIIDPLTDELDQRYTNFVDYFQKWLSARDRYKNAIRYSDSDQHPSNSYLRFERRLKQDLPMLDMPTMGGGNVSTDDHLSENLPIPKPPDESESKTKVKTK